MTTDLTFPAGVSLVAHRRLRDAREQLAAKLGGAGRAADIGFGGGRRRVAVRDTERRVHALLDAALDQMQGAGGPVPLGRHSTLAPGPSRFTVLGTAGYHLAGVPVAAPPGVGDRLLNIVRTGSPDPHLLPLLARTTELPLAVRRQAVAAGTSDEIASAFAHGMLDAAASAVVVDPVLRGLHNAASTRDWCPGDPQPEAAALARRIRGELFGDANYLGAWPDTSQIPAELFAGYAAALEEIHRIGTDPPVGWPSFEAGDRPVLAIDGDLVAVSYQVTHVDRVLSTWSMGDWYAFLLPLWVAPSLGLILARYTLPNASAFFDPRSPDEASWSEMLTLPTLLGSIAPFAWSMVLWGEVPAEDAVFAEALVAFLLRLGLGTWWTASTAVGDAEAGVRWSQFGLIAGIDLHSIVRGVIAAAEERSLAQVVHLLQTIPLGTGLWTTLLALIADAAGVEDEDGFWIFWAVATAVQLLGGIGLAAAMEGWSIAVPRRCEGEGFALVEATRSLDDPRDGDLAGFAALFDDSTLWSATGTDTPGLPDLRYPSGTRPLLRIWFEGTGTLTITHDRHHVTVDHDGTPHTIIVPRGDRSVATLAAALEDAVDGIRTSQVDDDPDPLLPWPHALADPGDGAVSRRRHDDQAAEPQPVGSTEDDAYLLRHAPMSDHSTLMGLGHGDASRPDPVPVVPARGLGDIDSTAMGAAADLAVLFHLGAAGHFDTVTPDVVAPALPDLDAAHEVFRHWNLDARRVNEWRQLVTGGAEADKPDPAVADPGMLAGRAADNAAPEGAEIADALGWVPLWRAWLRMAGDITTDADDDVVMAYTPAVRRRDGSMLTPTNRQLTAGIRHVLDLP